MKKLLVIYFFTLIVFSANGQEYCLTIEGDNVGAKEGNTLKSFCTSYSHTKLVNINIHFLLTDNGTQNYTSTNGLNGDSYSGIDIANDIVETANWLFMNNIQLHQPVGNQTSINPVRIQWKLKGVYFDNNSAAQSATASSNWENQFLSLANNTSTEINVFLTTANIGSSGVASDLGIRTNRPPLIFIGNFGDFESQVMHPALPFRFKLFWFADLLNHELGHLLNLRHPFVSSSSQDCSAFNPDFCLDTYTFCNEFRGSGGNDCFYPLFPVVNPYDNRTCNTTNYSNTFMDYNMNHKGISPCQIDRMHARLCGNGANYFEYCVPSPMDVYVSSSSYVGPLTNSTFGITSGYCQLSISGFGLSNFVVMKTGGSGSFSQYGSTVSISGLGTIYLKVSADSECGPVTRTIVLYNYGGSYRIAPNPSIDYVNILGDDDKKISFYNDKGILEDVIIESKFTEVVIYNEYGKRKKHKKFKMKTKNTKINVNSLKPGLYFVEIINDYTSFRSSFVKI